MSGASQILHKSELNICSITYMLVCMCTYTHKHTHTHTHTYTVLLSINANIENKCSLKKKSFHLHDNHNRIAFTIFFLVQSCKSKTAYIGACLYNRIILNLKLLSRNIPIITMFVPIEMYYLPVSAQTAYVHNT